MGGRILITEATYANAIDCGLASEIDCRQLGMYYAQLHIGGMTIQWSARKQEERSIERKKLPHFCWTLIRLT